MDKGRMTFVSLLLLLLVLEADSRLPTGRDEKLGKLYYVQQKHFHSSCSLSSALLEEGKREYYLSDKL